MSSQTPINKSTFFRTNQKVHTALIAGQVLFIIICLIINKNQPFYYKWPGRRDPFFQLALVLTAGGAIGGLLLFGRKTISISLMGSLDEKLAAYQRALIRRFSLLEGPSLVTLVLALSTHNSIYLQLSAVLIIYLITLRPSQKRFENDIVLNPEQQSELRGSI